MFLFLLLSSFFGAHTQKKGSQQETPTTIASWLSSLLSLVFLCVFHLMFNLTYPSRQLMGRLRFVRVSALLVCGGGGSPTSQWGKAWQSWRHLLWATVGWGFKRRQTQPGNGNCPICLDLFSCAGDCLFASGEGTGFSSFFSTCLDINWGYR